MQRNDHLWKGILEDIFDDFLRFMHHDADEIFDFSRGITFLDKELKQLFPPEGDEFSPKIVDKLAKLYTHEGKEEWILIHCEVQGKYEANFPLRMFKYFSRIFDKYGKRVSAYAILTEETPKTRTNKYVIDFLGTKLEYNYNIYKISQQSESELLKSDNPFAMVVLTVRSVMETKHLDDKALFEIKIKLARQFLNKSFPKEKIRLILDFLKSYIYFEDRKNSINFDNAIEQITGRKETMGLVEQVLEERERYGIKIGKKLGEKRGIELGEKRGEKRGWKLGERHGWELGERHIINNMLRKNLSDEMIADLAEVSLEYVQEIRRKNNIEI
jgi:predicted transposase YdaD